MFKNSVFRVSVDTKEWLKAAGKRAAWTMAQAALALIPAGATIEAVDWKIVVSTAICAGVISLLKSVVAGVPEVEAKEGK